MKKENKKQEEQGYVRHYSIVSDIIYFAKFFRRYEPVVLVCCAIEIILGALLPLFGIYLPKITIDLVVQGADMKKTVLVLGLFTLVMMTVYGLHSIVANGKYYLYNAQRSNFIGLLFLKSLRIKYEYTESGEMKKGYWKAIDGFQMGDWSASSRMITGTVNLLNDALCFCLYSMVIGTLSPGMLAFVIGLSLISYFFSMCHIQYEESLRDERAQAERKYYAVLSSMGNSNGAKDIRIFGMNHWLTTLRDQALSEVIVVGRKSAKKRSFYEKLGFGLTMIRDLGAYGFLIYQAVHGEITASEFVLYFGAITGFSGFVMSIMNSLSDLRAAANSTDYIRAYMELPEEDRESGSRHIDELSMPLKIEFKNVSFSYKDVEELSSDEQKDNGAVSAQSTGSEGKTIFRNLNLTINAGENIALVGVNGAGKTTLVKLLCGMYDPDSGQILINGIDRNEFPRKELYELFSVVFQEQLLFPFTVGENIALSRENRVDEKRAWIALEKAGLKTVFEEKKIGMKTYMTRQMMNNGIELSGGQQQRFLLARALYKDAPILILDEPTAALDPIAESEVYHSYNQYSGNKTAIFISHRLASTRFSDRIVMLENGRILEMGTHEELMKKNGAYAEMFRVQSSYYEDAV